MFRSFSKELQPRTRFVIAIFVAILAMSYSRDLLAISFDSSGNYTLGENSQCDRLRVFGDRVMYVVETKSLVARLPDSEAREANLRDYLYTARLTDDGKVVEPIIVGPIYRHDGPVSSMANAGVPFNKDDFDFLNAKPYFDFGPDGRLVKTLYAKDGKTVRTSELIIKDKKSHWDTPVIRPRLPLIGAMSEERFESESGRYVVQKQQDGKIHVYDTWKYEEFSSPWVEAVAADFISQEDLGNRNVFLTDDLKFVMVDPASFTHFKQKGRTYDGTNHFLTYSSPGKKAVVHELGPEDAEKEKRDQLTVGRRMAIDGKLHFLGQAADFTIELCNSDYKVVETHALSIDEKWIMWSKDGLYTYTYWENDPAGKRIRRLPLAGSPNRAARPPGVLALSQPKDHSIRIADWHMHFDRNKAEHSSRRTLVPIEHRSAGECRRVRSNAGLRFERPEHQCMPELTYAGIRRIRHANTHAPAVSNVSAAPGSGTAFTPAEAPAAGLPERLFIAESPLDGSMPAVSLESTGRPLKPLPNVDVVSLSTSVGALKPNAARLLPTFRFPPGMEDWLRIFNVPPFTVVLPVYVFEPVRTTVPGLSTTRLRAPVRFGVKVSVPPPPPR